MRIDVTGGLNSGKTDEKNVLRSRLEADHCYVMDRWYAQFTLFNEINTLGSSYACRMRDNTATICWKNVRSPQRPVAPACSKMWS